MQRIAAILFSFVLLSACGGGSGDDGGGGTGDSDDSSTGGSVKLSIHQGAHGRIAATPAGPYELGDVVTLTATPDDGYGFGGWSGVDGFANPATITLDDDTTVSASFVKDAVSLLVSASPVIGGTVAVDPAPPYTVGQEVQVTATPATGYRLSGWDGASSTDASLSLTLSANTTLTAQFARIPAKVQLAIQPDGAATFTIDPPGQLYVGDSATVTVTPNPGWVFGSWAGGSQSPSMTLDVSETTTLNVTMVPVPLVTGDATHTGNEDPYTIAWTYAGSTSSYTVEESYNGGPFGLFVTKNTTASSFALSIDVNRAPGTHCYRVRAARNLGYSPYGNTFCVNRLPGEKRVKIVNDNISWKPSGTELNEILGVFFGGANPFGGINQLPRDSSSLPGTTIKPGTWRSFSTANQEASYHIGMSMGYWEYLCSGFVPCYWTPHQTIVTGCDGSTAVYKRGEVVISDHTFDTITINTSDWLPNGNYAACPNGGACVKDPVCN